MRPVKLRNIFCNQLSIDFGEEFKIKERELYIDYPNNEDDYPFITCEMCDETICTNWVSIASNGRRKIITEYSDTFGFICDQCYEAKNGDEIMQRQIYRRSLLSRMIEIRGITTFDDRTVIIEKTLK